MFGVSWSVNGIANADYSTIPMLWFSQYICFLLCNRRNPFFSCYPDLPSFITRWSGTRIKFHERKNVLDYSLHIQAIYKFSSKIADFIDASFFFYRAKYFSIVNHHIYAHTHYTHKIAAVEMWNRLCKQSKIAWNWCMVSYLLLPRLWFVCFFFFFVRRCAWAGWCATFCHFQISNQNTHIFPHMVMRMFAEMVVRHVLSIFESSKTL